MLKCNMSQRFSSDITMRQCHVTSFRTWPCLALLHLVVFLKFTSPPRQFRILILKLAFAIKFSFMYLLHIWLYTCTIDLRGDIKKNPGPRPRTGWKVSKYGPEKTPYSNNFHKVQFLLNFFDLPLEPKQYNCAFLC